MGSRHSVARCEGPVLDNGCLETNSASSSVTPEYPALEMAAQVASDDDQCTLSCDNSAVMTGRPASEMLAQIIDEGWCIVSKIDTLPSQEDSTRSSVNPKCATLEIPAQSMSACSSNSTVIPECTSLGMAAPAASDNEFELLLTKHQSLPCLPPNSAIHNTTMDDLNHCDLLPVGENGYCLHDVKVITCCNKILSKDSAVTTVPVQTSSPIPIFNHSTMSKTQRQQSCSSDSQTQVTPDSSISQQRSNGSEFTILTNASQENVCLMEQCTTHNLDVSVCSPKFSTAHDSRENNSSFSNVILCADNSCKEMSYSKSELLTSSAYFDVTLKRRESCDFATDTVPLKCNFPLSTLQINSALSASCSELLSLTDLGCKPNVLKKSASTELTSNPSTEIGESYEESDDSDVEEDEDGNVDNFQEDDELGNHNGIFPAISSGPMAVVNSKIKGKNVHIGPKFVLERSPSVEAPLSDSSLEEDFLMDANATLRGRYKTLAFCEVSLLFENKKLHVRDSLPLCLDELDRFAKTYLTESHIKSLHDTSKLLTGDVSRVLIEGPAGYGKSTFCLQIAHDWATNNDSPFACFELCFLVQGKTVTTSFLKTLLNQIRVDGDEDLVIRSFRRAKRPMLILIDGYDELNDVARTQVDNIIRLQVLPIATVIVTSRPHKCNEILNNFQKRVILRGFAADQIEEYSKTFSQGTIQKVIRIVRDKVHILQNLLQSPLFLHFFCYVADEHQELQIYPSVTALFHAALLKALNRNSIKMQRLQDIEFLVLFGKLCMKNLNEDKVTFMTSDLRNCCRKVSIDALLGLGVIGKDYNMRDGGNEDSYFAVHNSIVEFFTALYLSTVIDTEDHSKFLCRVLNRKQGFQSLLPQFLIGLTAGRLGNVLQDFENVLQQLPRSLLYTKIFTLCTMSIEVMPFGYTASLLKYFPESLRLSLNAGYVSINNIPFLESPYCSTSEVTVSSGDEILTHDSQIWPRLLEFLSQENLPTRELYLELDANHIPAMDSAFQFFNALCTSSKITTVSVTASKPTTELSELLPCLKRLKNLRHLVLNIASLAGSEKLLDALSTTNASSFENLETLKLIYNKDSCLTELQLNKLRDIAIARRRLSSLTLQHVSSSESLVALASMTAEAPQVRHLVLKLNTSKMSIPKRRWRKDINCQHTKDFLCQLASTCLHPICLQLTDRSCPLTTLDISCSCLKPEDVTALTSCVTHANCSVTSLVLANCRTAKTVPLHMDLSALVPLSKAWLLLNLSGWKISYKLEKAGTISELIVFDATLRCIKGVVASFRETSIVDLFSVQKLHCNLQQAFNTTKPLLCPYSSLVHLKICCPNQSEGSDLPVFFESLQQLRLLSSLDLHCPLEDITNFDCWENFLSQSSLTSLHLEHTQSNYEYCDCKETVFKMAQIALQKIPRLTSLTVVAVAVPFTTLWMTYLPNFMTHVCNAFTNHSLQSLNLSQRPELYKEFLVCLEQWEAENECKFDVRSYYQYGQERERMDIALLPKSRR